MAVLRSAFGEWRNHHVTQELHETLRELVEDEVAKMVNRDRPDPERDQFIRAFARVADSVISWVPEFIQEEEDKENA